MPRSLVCAVVSMSDADLYLVSEVCGSKVGADLLASQFVEVAWQAAEGVGAVRVVGGPITPLMGPDHGYFISPVQFQFVDPV